MAFEQVMSLKYMRTPYVIMLCALILVLKIPKRRCFFVSQNPTIHLHENRFLDIMATRKFSHRLQSLLLCSRRRLKSLSLEINKSFASPSSLLPSS
ncbi:hypothetical protein CEXT_333661 [Caerostris extrusa]|uniref:Uncharacterized protein n=1 Tax=Caerostris extrusa TaxID=172846 RepID=A0AAV4NIB1_CAEEX|nr:hypothetical protein CEXT_333661 [Caerostris extrusa]